MVNKVNITNHNLLDIPSELKEFMNNDTYSLLVKGPSGSGKTTFSLTILHSLKAKKQFFLYFYQSFSKTNLRTISVVKKIRKGAK